MEGSPEFSSSMQSPAKGSSRAKAKEVRKSFLVNELNYINFQDGTLLLNFRHNRYPHQFSLPAKPQPCLGEYLDCIFVAPAETLSRLKAYRFQDFILATTRRTFQVEAEVVEQGEGHLRLRLPEACREIGSRRVARHPCSDIEVQLAQNGAVFHGRLLDFNAVSFRAEVATAPPQTFHWIQDGAPVSITLASSGEILYAGECGVLRQGGDQRLKTYVLQPLQQQIRRFRPKTFRSRRQKLVPSPNVVFHHPLTGRLIDLEVFDLSGSGLAVEEEAGNSLLLPGMIIPEMELNFANTFRLRCRGQVIYRRATEEDDRVRCGIAVLDMAVGDQVRLLSLLHQSNDRNFYICNRLDLDSLWKFFFETGFIYPQKYAHIQAYKDRFKATYEKLYTRNPDIAMHFVYQDKGVILAHMAMLRFYENAWMIHHHAANRLEASRGGLMVLSQISRYVNEVHHLFSAHLQYVFCYFRPENRFPRRVFGGVADHINDLKGCSVDTFAYFRHRGTFEGEWDRSGPWSLTRTQTEELWELKTFLENESGGLLFQAFDLEPGAAEETLAKDYRKLGLKREKHLFSLRKEGVLKAVILVNLSDIGLNLSDLTNCCQIFVLDPDDLPRETLSLMLSMLCLKFEQQEMPVLLYPTSYADRQSLPYDKQYNLWILNLQYLDSYFNFCNALTKAV